MQERIKKPMGICLSIGLEAMWAGICTITCSMLTCDIGLFLPVKREDKEGMSVNDHVEHFILAFTYQLTVDGLTFSLDPPNWFVQIRAICLQTAFWKRNNRSCSICRGFLSFEEASSRFFLIWSSCLLISWFAWTISLESHSCVR